MRSHPDINTHSNDEVSACDLKHLARQNDHDIHEYRMPSGLYVYQIDNGVSLYTLKELRLILVDFLLHYRKLK